MHVSLTTKLKQKSYTEENAGKYSSIISQSTQSLTTALTVFERETKFKNAFVYMYCVVCVCVRVINH